TPAPRQSSPRHRASGCSSTVICSLEWQARHRALLSFPTRRSSDLLGRTAAFASDAKPRWAHRWIGWDGFPKFWSQVARDLMRQRSEEHTSELQSRENLVCRLLLEKKNRSLPL